MHCGSCGLESDATRKLCGECGAGLGDASALTQSVSPSAVPRDPRWRDELRRARDEYRAIGAPAQAEWLERELAQ